VILLEGFIQNHLNQNYICLGNINAETVQNVSDIRLLLSQLKHME